MQLGIVVNNAGRAGRTAASLAVVGTHYPDDRDVMESALQRMREAFEALRDGRMTPSRAEEEFLAGYDTARDMAGALFLARRMSAAGSDRAVDRPAAPD